MAKKDLIIHKRRAKLYVFEYLLIMVLVGGFVYLLSQRAENVFSFTSGMLLAIDRAVILLPILLTHIFISNPVLDLIFYEKSTKMYSTNISLLENDLIWLASKVLAVTLLALSGLLVAVVSFIAASAAVSPQLTDVIVNINIETYIATAGLLIVSFVSHSILYTSIALHTNTVNAYKAITPITYVITLAGYMAAYKLLTVADNMHIAVALLCVYIVIAAIGCYIYLSMDKEQLYLNN